MEINKEASIEIINKFEGRKIAVVGDIALDSYIYGTINRLNPESAAILLTVHDEQEEHTLGCAGNVARNLTALGADVSLFTVIGNDERGNIVEKICEKEGIKLICAKEGITIKKQRWFEKGHNYYLFRTDLGESKLYPISEKAEEELLTKLNSEKYDAIILSDYNKKVFRNNFAKKIIEMANSRGILTLADPKPANINSFKGIKVIRPNEKEAREITGLNNGADIQEVAKKLKEIVNSKYCVITRGKDGMITYDNDFHHIKTKARKVSDVSGAGDTVAAVLALSLANGSDIVTAANIANHAAGIVVAKPGTAVTSREELINSINADETV